MSGASEQPRPDARLVARAAKLRLDRQIARLAARLQREGTEFRLLKGPVTAQWLYPGEERRYLDCDLLIAPDDLVRVEEALESLDYSRDFDDRSMPPWWREHASPWVRERDGVTVDLHRTLPGIKAALETVWQVLSENPDRVVVGGQDVPTLSLPARTLHVALHAAQHGSGWTVGPVADLKRALAACDDEVWRQAADLARALQAEDAFVTGLELTEAGRRLAQRLGLIPSRSVEAALRASTPPPIALGFEQLARATGGRARLAILARKLVPPPSFIRHWDPRANESRAALVRAYLRRPLWLLRRSPEGFRAWVKARRSVRNARRQSHP